ncbi:fungal-specific transcription factor domain-containing protein [Xylaria cf. heliscus]|nr:fungal-specific transcription factor domain-containing protein [Xylaria cf. heliscus]
MGGKRQSATEETRIKSIPERSSSEAAPKRQRVSRACDQCRAAREKCDGIQPLCFPCASQNRRCSWEEPKKKRGVQTGYIRTLEMALGWIFDKIPESEISLHGLLTHEGGQGRLLLAGKDTAAGNRLHRRWRKSTVHAEIERVLSGDTTSTGSANDSTPGGESDEDVPEKDLSTPQDGKPTSNVSEPTAPLKSEREISDRAQPRSQWHKDATTCKGSVANMLKSPPNLSSPRSQRPSTVGLPSNHWRLLDIYFSYTHIWFPILEKHELLKTGYSYSDEGLHVTRDTPGSAGHAELWAALALASYQEMASRTAEGPEEAHPNSTYMKPRDIYRMARNLIPTEDGFFEARHVNALLLLTLVNMACNDLRAAWMLIGTASRVALSLRLHGNSVSTRHNQSSHTYMGCFILDTLLSARLGLLPHLRSGMAHISMPRLDNDLDEWQPWMPCSDFGPSKQDTRPSRMPSHSISSFGILHRIHLVLSHRLWDDTENSLRSGDAFLRTLQNAVNQCGAQVSLSNCVLTGEHMTGQLPSIHLLRLAFLCTASMRNGFPHLHRAALSCVESYVGNFGVCGLSPLLSVFMKLVDQQVQSNVLTGEERGRWKQIENAIRLVWAEPPRNYESDTRHEDVDSTHFPQQPSPAFGLAPNMQSEQSSTATLLHPNTHGSAHTGLPFSQDPNVKMSELATHQPAPETETLHLNGPCAAIGEFEDLDTLAISPSIHFPGSGRPGFSGPALDYDTILDDIASFERTSVPESDTQFMANLGLRPGTNLADVFSHEFMGFS